MNYLLSSIKAECRVICEDIIIILTYSKLFNISLEKSLLCILVIQGLIPEFIAFNNQDKKVSLQTINILLINTLKIFISIFLSSYLLNVSVISVCIMNLLIIVTFILSEMIDYFLE